MKTIGLLGGMSWESSAVYYRLINEGVAERLGGLHSAQSLMFSFDFDEIQRLQHADRWDEATCRLIEAARRLEHGGADFVVLCTNTMHRVAHELQQVLHIPLLHIADPTAAAIEAHGLHTVGLLATRFTMEQDFYTGRLVHRYGLRVLTPDVEERAAVHAIIYEQLCRGIITPQSRERYREIIRSLVDRGAEGVVLGCTEIMLLIGQDDSPVPIFDTTALHARAAVMFALDK